MASLALGLSSMVTGLHSLSSFAGTSLTRPSSVSIALVSTAPKMPMICFGRGDRKTAKGKRKIHSFGNCRPRKARNGRGPFRIPIPANEVKKRFVKKYVEEEEEPEENEEEENDDGAEDKKKKKDKKKK